MRIRFVAALSVAIAAGPVGGLVLPGPGHSAAAAESPMSFKDDVLPVFREHCVSCHNAPDGDGYKASGLDLTSYQGVMKGTKFGPMVIAGTPDASNLMRLLDWQASPQLRMPHGQKQLSVCDRDAIRTWIRQGAKNN
jgi:hypothetical protein